MAADGGWGFGWVLGGLAVGGVIGYRLVPWMQRVEEVENLESLAERILSLADNDKHKVEALEICKKIEEYKQGVLEKKAAAEDHEGFMTQARNALRLIVKKVSPKKKKKENKEKKELSVQEELEAALS